MKSSPQMILGTSLALLLASATSALAAAPRSRSEWVQHYYQSPEPDQVVPAVFALSREGYFESAGQPATAIGFLSSVFAQNPGKVDEWMVAFRQLPPAHRRVVAAAHWYSGVAGGDRELRAIAAESDPALKAELNELLAQGPSALARTPVLSESSLNLQWGAFLASGEKQHVINALAALGSGAPGLSTTARYSLAQKAVAHARVYEICQNELSRQPAGVQDQMRAALADAKSGR